MELATNEQLFQSLHCKKIVSSLIIVVDILQNFFDFATVFLSVLVQTRNFYHRNNMKVTITKLLLLFNWTRELTLVIASSLLWRHNIESH